LISRLRIAPAIEPPATGVRFEPVRDPAAPEIVAEGIDFRPGTLLAAYRNGIFPWPHEAPSRARHSNARSRAPSQPVVFWFSPNPRAIFPLEQAHPPPWSRSLRRTLRRHPYQVTINHAFRDVIRLCGQTRSDGTWIIPELIEGYERLHELGWAHSLEVWDSAPTPDDGSEHSALASDRAATHALGTLVGGIYGIAIGGMFAGESMFHRRTDASKIAFAHLVEVLRAGGFSLFDVQVQNPHLASLGCIEIERSEYLTRLERALITPARLAKS